ncbi:MAG: Holliday junction resolvase RuvX [Lachnospiraceae bacterium]|nr:Holliday junction resolvase RuvX [Lachnospiraceae bacterium]
MGLDFGSKTVGVAVSDPFGIIASGVETIRREREKKLRQTLARIDVLIAEYDVGLIVLGLPKHMNDDIGDRAKLSYEFRDELKRRTGLDVIMWDERLTTVQAGQIMNELDIRGTKRKKIVDTIAAEFILQNYLDYRNNTLAADEDAAETGK